MNSHKNKLLKGIRVLDFSRILVGAYSSMLLADLGAEVIKVEPPGGDETRGWGPPFRNSDSVYFLSINRNKKSICMDLKNSQAKEIAMDLIKKSDVLLENYTFNKMNEFGLDYESVKNYNDKIIYSTVNSYGNKGPMKKTPSFDLIIQSYVGIMNITGGPSTEPFKVGYPMCDIMAGSHVYGAIMAALLHKERTGEGQYLNTSLLEANLFSMPTIVSNYLNEGINAQRRGNDHPTISPYTVFKLKNEEYVSIGVATDKQFFKLWKVFKFDENKEIIYTDYATNELRLKNREKLKEILQDSVLSYDETELLSNFESSGIPFSKINSMKDLFENNKQIEELELIKEINTEDYGNLKYIRNPITYSKINTEEMKSPPTLGRDTKILLKEMLDYNDEKIDNLYKNKVIF